MQRGIPKLSENVFTESESHGDGVKFGLQKHSDRTKDSYLTGNEMLPNLPVLP